MTESEIITKLREANLPPYVMGTTLAEENALAMRDIVKHKTFRVSHGLVSYTIVPPSARGLALGRSARLAAVFGKELVLSNIPVHFISLAGFLREVRLQTYDTDADPVSGILRAPGYWIITGFDDVQAHPSPDVWRAGLDMLMTHVARGGGVVLSYDNPTPDSITPSFDHLRNSFTALAA